MPISGPMFRVVPDMLDALGMVLPPWAVGLVLACIAALMVPGYLYWVRSRRVKGLLRALGRASTDPQRARLADEAMALATGRPRVLVALADDAHRLGMNVLRDRAMAELQVSGAAPEDFRRLLRLVRRDAPPPMHPVEEAVFVERMITEGLLAAARQRLEPARARFPEDPELAELEARLVSLETAPSSQAG